MVETPKKVTGSLVDFVEGVTQEGEQLDIEVAAHQSGKIAVFHSHPFTKDISWFEFDLKTNILDFVMDDGDVRDIGLPLTADLAKHMQNTHQILTVLMDPKTGDSQEGRYIPLILHGS